MKLPILIPASVPIAKLPRVFVRPEIPGYISRKGTCCLPLTLGADAVDTGIPENRKGEVDKIKKLGPRFAQRPNLIFLDNQAQYLDHVGPSWVHDIVDGMQETISTYERSDSGSLAMIQRQVLAPLRSEWSGVKELILASLYMGFGTGTEDAYSLYTHDLTFFGREPASLYGMLQFLKIFHEAYQVLSTGMIPRLGVRTTNRGKEKIRDLYDPVAKQPEPHFEYVDIFGDVHCLKKSGIRPFIVLETNESGRIILDSYQEGASDPIYGDFKEMVARRSQIFLGLYLCAHYSLRRSQIADLTRDPKTTMTAKLRQVLGELEGDTLNFQAALFSHALTTF